MEQEIHRQKGAVLAVMQTLSLSVGVKESRAGLQNSQFITKSALHPSPMITSFGL